MQHLGMEGEKVLSMGDWLPPFASLWWPNGRTARCWAHLPGHSSEAPVWVGEGKALTSVGLKQETSRSPSHVGEHLSLVSFRVNLSSLPLAMFFSLGRTLGGGGDLDSPTTN